MIIIIIIFDETIRRAIKSPFEYQPHPIRRATKEREREEERGSLFSKSKDSQEDAVVGAGCIRSNLSRMNRGKKGWKGSRGIGRGISRNIAAFSRAGAQNPPNRPCLSNNHIHTGHFPREQWSRYLFPAMIKGCRLSCASPVHAGHGPLSRTAASGFGSLPRFLASLSRDFRGISNLSPRKCRSRKKRNGYPIFSFLRRNVTVRLLTELSEFLSKKLEIMNLEEKNRFIYLS